jgi:LmbE family N-acetylglucosaminyl deacetylase
MLKAANVIGIPEVYSFGKPDGGVKASDDLINGIAELIREKQYALMLLPSGFTGEHPDHVETYKAGMEARRRAARPGEIGNQKDSHLVPLVAEGQIMIVRPDVFIHRVDTTPVALSTKNHWESHKSQLRDVRYETFFGSQ